MAGSTGGVGEADECLAGMGYSAGVRGVVRRFRERTVALQELALRWQPNPPPATSTSGEFAPHPGGIFSIEVIGTGTVKLVHVWPGWGRRTLGSGNNPERLRSDALSLLRRGGPFGGPTAARSGDRIVQVHETQGGTRQPLPDGSEVRVLLLEPQSVAVRIWPDSKFAQIPVVGQNDPTKLIDDDAEYLVFGGSRVLWMFTDVHPLVGAMRADPYDILLCPLRTNRVALLAVEGTDLLGIKIGSWDELRAMDAGAWIGGFEPRQAPSTAKTEGKPPGPPKTEKKAKSAKPTSGEKKTAKPGSAETGAAGEASAGAPKRRRRVATSPGGTPGPRGRRVRVKPGLAAAITQHLASVAATLPAGKLGAAFAVELLRALEAAALSNLPTLTGTTVDLFSRLHKKGFLSAVPADQAGRAALKLLAERTPLVRRLHYRRWSFVFGDIHVPTSELCARLGPVPAE